MVPASWVALLVLVVAVLPGAVYTYAFERQAGSFGATFADRVLRFVVASVVFDVLYAAPAYLLYRAGVHPPWRAGELTGAWVAGVAALTIPAVFGTVVGGLYVSRGTREGWKRVRRLLDPDVETRLLQLVLGRDPAPKAWDHCFSEKPTAYLRVRCHDGRWLGGLFAEKSYAGGFPQDADLLIEQAWPVDEFGVFGDAPLGYRLYVPASTIAYVEIVEPDAREA